MLMLGQMASKLAAVDDLKKRLHHFAAAVKDRDVALQQREAYIRHADHQLSNSKASRVHYRCLTER